MAFAIKLNEQHDLAAIVIYLGFSAMPGNICSFQKEELKTLVENVSMEKKYSRHGNQGFVKADKATIIRIQAGVMATS